MRPMGKPTRTQLLSCFTIEIQHELEGGKPWTAFEAACLFLAVRDKIWSFEIMGLVDLSKEKIIILTLFVRKKILI